LVFADGVPPQVTLDRYYREQSKYEYSHNDGRASELDERRFRDIAAAIAPHLSKNSRVLEVGCATGRLLAVVREIGIDSVEGLDPSPGCAQAAWKLYGVPVQVGTIADLSAYPGAIDCVILVGVLEHLEDVRGALANVRGALRPRACVYAEVPDAANLAGRQDSAYQEFSTEHINFFSTTSLAGVFNVSGFEVVTTGSVVRQQHSNTLYPAAYGIFRRANAPSPFVVDRVTEPGLQRYIDESAQVEAHVRGVLDRLAGGRRVFVWGVGTHTRRLLAIGAFENVRVEGFVDSNPKYHGRYLVGAPVIAPSDLVGRREPILISTRGFQTEIEHQIRSELALDNEIIRLYQ